VQSKFNPIKNAWSLQEDTIILEFFSFNEKKLKNGEKIQNLLKSVGKTRTIGSIFQRHKLLQEKRKVRWTKKARILAVHMYTNNDLTPKEISVFLNNLSKIKCTLTEQDVIDYLNSLYPSIIKT
jgi:uncharacterized protein YktA (UPF0223 family)